MTEHTWLTYREAARRVGRSVRTIKRWRRAGMPMRLENGFRQVRLDILQTWYRRKLKAWPTHQYRMRRLSNTPDE